MSSISQNHRIAIIACLVLASAGLIQLPPALVNSRSLADSDLLRQWKTSQYVLAGTNPYPVALAALRARYGLLWPHGSVRLNETRIYGIPPSGPDPATIPELGPPEATYPPTSEILFAATMGHFLASSARTAWFVLNLCLLPLLVWELLLLLELGTTSPLMIWLVAALAVAWPPVTYCFEREQFSLFVLWSVLLASRLETTRPLLSGLCWSLALIKPSLALPYLLVPLAAKHWKVLGVVGTVQVALLASAGMRLSLAPWTLVHQWLAVAAYFRQGMYTAQEVINGLHLDGTVLDSLIPVGILVVAFPFTRRLTRVRALAFLSFISMIWIYHGLYDFIVLLVPGTLLVSDLLIAPPDTAWILSAVGFTAIGFALLPTVVHNGDNVTYHVVRWIARISLDISMLVAARAEPPGENRETPSPLLVSETAAEAG